MAFPESRTARRALRFVLLKERVVAVQMLVDRNRYRSSPVVNDEP
jgi:hypothetical protein